MAQERVQDTLGPGDKLGHRGSAVGVARDPSASVHHRPGAGRHLRQGAGEFRSPQEVHEVPQDDRLQRVLGRCQ